MILDTNAVSDFADANQRLLNCLQQTAADIHLPIIVLGEYRYSDESIWRQPVAELPKSLSSDTFPAVSDQHSKATRPARFCEGMPAAGMCGHV